MPPVVVSLTLVLPIDTIQKISGHTNKRLVLRAVCRLLRDGLRFGGARDRPLHVRVDLSASHDGLLRSALLSHFTHTTFTLDGKSPHFKALSDHLASSTELTKNTVALEMRMVDVGKSTRPVLIELARRVAGMPFLPSAEVANLMENRITRIGYPDVSDTDVINALAERWLSHPHATDAHTIAGIRMMRIRRAHNPSDEGAIGCASELFRLATTRRHIEIRMKLVSSPQLATKAVQVLRDRTDALLEQIVAGPTADSLRRLLNLYKNAHWLCNAVTLSLSVAPTLLGYISSPTRDAEVAQLAVQALTSFAAMVSTALCFCSPLCTTLMVW